MKSVMGAIADLAAQIMAITSQVQNLANAAGKKATVISTTSMFAMTMSQVKVEDAINYSNKVNLSLWKAMIEVLSTKFDM